MSVGSAGSASTARTLGSASVCVCVLLTARLGSVVTTPEQQHNYHKDCFVCFVCQSSLVTQPFYPEGDEVVCAKHLGSVGAGVCPKCGLNIDNEYVPRVVAPPAS